MRSVWFICNFYPLKFALEYDLSCIIRKDDVFFMEIWSYSLDRKLKMIFFKKIHDKYNIFCKFGKDDISFSYRYDITLLPKKQSWSSPEKMH